MKEVYYCNGKEMTVGEIINDLLSKKVIAEKKPFSDVHMDLDYYVTKAAKRCGAKTDKDVLEFKLFLSDIKLVYPAAALGIILKQIAVELDKKYPDHISESPQIYCVSLTNGLITRVNKAHVKNYQNFAAFRNVEDAQIACRICSSEIREMFNE